MKHLKMNLEYSYIIAFEQNYANVLKKYCKNRWTVLIYPWFRDIIIFTKIL